MPPNRDEVTAVSARAGGRGVETSTFVAEDFCLIDDPPECNGGLDELAVGDEAERPVKASTAQAR